MNQFIGFNDTEPFTSVPDSFFRDLLGGIEDAGELKVCLHAFWRIGQMEGSVRCLRREDFVGVMADPDMALDKAVRRGTLLKAEHNGQALYFINTPRGRAAAKAYNAGELSIDPGASGAPAAHPNIFKLYEENIGPLTPLIADALRDAEQTYSEEWTAEALEIAALKNKRNWKYIEAILHRWKEEGHAKKQDRRDTQEDGGRYSEGEFAEYLKRG